ncbi:hypothetical protein [Pedobacter rhizosphaerae]|uniref:Uncharacterized protein n=1 Tax=Pedobacter rhizosphaerae TaxID=390241 RepID=A0A1H9J4X9_9SPHI|nr:hypothetical protein [Pedobacter rhizosphaerae]SEQ82101.1 hypothetical protein SAMN04488023_101228 [Pedobacter rhizosphaerae]
MIKILRAIGFGIVLGATLFFVPFVFKFILIALFIGLIFKMYFKAKRRHFMQYYRQDFGFYNEPIVPIDNSWYRPNIQGNGKITQININ